MMRIREYCTAAVRGQRLYPFINAVREAGLICLSQHCKGGVFYCRVRRSEMPAFTALARQHGLEVQLREERSVLRQVRRLRLHIGLPVGAVLGLALLLYLSNIISVIEVQGAQPAQVPVILSVLSQEGVERGTWIGAVDAYRCEQLVRARVEGLAWVGIRHTGSRLVVEVTQRTAPPAMLDERLPCNIVAAHDARITSMEVYAGLPVRQVGDGVTQGELLVSGVSETPEGTAHFHHSMAKITGVYRQETALTESYTADAAVPTGRTHTDAWLCFRQFSLPLGLPHKAYAQGTSVERYLPLCLLGRELPIGILRRYEEETAVQSGLRTQEETMLLLHAGIVRYEKNLLQEVTILDREILYDVTEEGMTAHVTYTLEGEIGIVREIYVK